MFIWQGMFEIYCMHRYGSVAYVSLQKTCMMTGWPERMHMSAVWNLVCLTCLVLSIILQACSMLDMSIIKLTLHQLPCHPAQMMRKTRRMMRKQVCFSFFTVLRMTLCKCLTLNAIVIMKLCPTYCSNCHYSVSLLFTVIIVYAKSILAKCCLE